MGIRNHVKRLRLAADGMTQQELARQVGVTRQTIISIEKNKYRPSVELALLLAGAFNVRVEDVFELADKEDGT
jgi:putative transcriptional regulator